MPKGIYKASLKKEIARLRSQVMDIPMVIGGKEVRTDNKVAMHPPHDLKHLLGHYHKGDASHVQMAIAAALEAKEKWAALSWEHRASIFLKAADLIAGPYRDTINAATMLCQSKNVFQAEIDSACEIIDFLRFNVNYMTEIYAQQPESSDGIWNRVEQRPLEGFIFALTPFNFTAIAGNLPTAPAMMGNTVVWKCSNTQVYPRIVGETGGKDFIFAHPTANVEALVVAMVRGAFEYQGQKCSAASRAYIPSSMWPEVRKQMENMIKGIKMGPTEDFSNFFNAVIDETSFDLLAGYIDRAKKDKDAEVIIGGGYDKSVGYFIEPTVILASDPQYLTMEEELFGPVLTLYVYEDDKVAETVEILNNTSMYALTGAIYAQDGSLCH